MSCAEHLPRVQAIPAPGHTPDGPPPLHADSTAAGSPAGSATLGLPDRVRPLLDCALEYAAHGLRVIPLKARSKLPSISGWPEKATLDPEVIRGWFGEDRESNLGIVGGHGLVILDVDTDRGGVESLCGLVAERGVGGRLPATAVVYTGSGGFHIYFRVPLCIGIPTGRDCVLGLPGLDIRAEGGQVVAPPSIHPETGKPYRWRWHPREGIALMPGWMKSILVAPGTSGDKPSPRKRRSVRRERGTTKKAPRCPLKRSAAEDGRLDVQASRNASGRLPGAFPRAMTGGTDERSLLADVIERFPVPGVGSRHAQMSRAVGSLLGRRHADETVRQVMMDWWEHFHQLGLTATGRDVMARELDACIDSTRSNPEFRAADSERDLEVTRADWPLPGRMLGRMNAPVADLRVLYEQCGCKGSVVDLEASTWEEQGRIEDPGYLGEDPPEDPLIHCNGGNTNQDSLIDVTRGSQRSNQCTSINSCEAGTSGKADKRPLTGALCESRDERYFVEAILAMLALHRHGAHRYATSSATPRFQWTHDQLRRVAASRFGLTLPVWKNPQIDRLKRKYITRIRDDGRHEPATRFELLREIEKGRRARGTDKGTPSVYEPTGIKVFFIPDDETLGLGQADCGVHEATSAVASTLPEISPTGPAESLPRSFPSRADPPTERPYG